MRFTALSFAFVLLAACQPATPQPAHPSIDRPGGGALVKHDEPGANCAPLGATRDDGCNACECTEQGWSCTAMFCDEPHQGTRAEDPKPPAACTPGQKMFAPNQNRPSTATCDMEPPACEAGTHLGDDGMCYICIPDEAPMDRDSDCVCNDDRRWVCTER